MPLGRSLLIVNPSARHGEASKLVDAIPSLVGGRFDYDLRITETPADCRESAARASGYDAVVAVGGDGAVHEVLNGLMRIPAESRPSLGTVPAGSGNDYCRYTLGFSPKLDEAFAQLGSSHTTVVDCGLINGLYFANSIGIGFDAQVTARAAEMKKETGRSGLPLYLGAVFDVLFTKLSTSHVQLGFEGSPPSPKDILFVAATIGPTYGGGFRISPDAVPDDGLLDVCLVDPLGAWGALARLPFFVVGHHGWMRHAHLTRKKGFTLSSPVTLLAEVDGEVIDGTTFEISVSPSAIEVLVPQGSSLPARALSQARTAC